MPPTRRTILALLAAAAVGTPARAQSFPTRPVRIVVPYPAGGPTDAIARLVAQEIQGDLGNSVIVENKPGAAGALGTREVARAEPDGHVLVLGTNQTHVTNAVLLKEAGYRLPQDFVAVAGLADLQHALVVPKDGARDLASLLARAKSDPGRLNYGSSGLGSASHLAMELLLARTGARMTHVAFRGAAPLALEIVAGRIDAAFATLPSVIGQIESADMVALALGSAQRAPQLPNLPLLADLGVADAEADAWLALFAPAATPAAVVSRLSQAVLSALGRPHVAAAAMRLGMVVNLRDSAAFARFLEAETRKWLEVVRLAGVKPE